MNVVCSETFKYIDDRNIEYRLKSYALDDMFYLDMNRFSAMGGSTTINVAMSVAEAQVLKKQLEEFIMLNK